MSKLHIGIESPTFIGYDNRLEFPMPIHFTDREMQKAWRNNFQAYNLAENKSNAHRLLLFYSIECGLKAAVMKRNGITSTLLASQVIEYGHNINKLLDALNVERSLRLPSNIKMSSNRQVSVEEIN